MRSVLLILRNHCNCNSKIAGFVGVGKSPSEYNKLQRYKHRVGGQTVCGEAFVVCWACASQECSLGLDVFKNDVLGTSLPS